LEEYFQSFKKMILMIEKNKLPLMFKVVNVTKTLEVKEEFSIANFARFTQIKRFTLILHATLDVSCIRLVHLN
jgi:hypothetical protein